MPRLEKPQHNTTHRKRHISKSTTFPTAAYQPYAKNNRKSPVSKQQFLSKNWQKRFNFPKKWGNRITIPDNLIVCISQSIGNFHETSQIFAHAEMITSNDQKRDHTGWATARGKEPVSRLEKPQHSRLMRNAQRYPILCLLQSIGGLQETQVIAHGEMQHITNLCTRWDDHKATKGAIWSHWMTDGKCI